MLIKKISIQEIELKLRHPYRIAYQSISSSRLIFIRLSTNTGLEAFGCAAPEEEITGESFEGALEFLDTQCREILKGSDPLRRMRILEDLRAISCANPSALAAVDMALLDLLGKEAGLPVWKIFGGYQRGIETSITIGIAPREETVAQARDMISRGFSIIKLKGGLSPEEDAEKLIRLREVGGPALRLRFDANQGYTAAETLRFLELAAPSNLEILEQPTPREEPYLLGEITGQIETPVMADESLLNLHEAFHLAQNELVDMMNIKLMKVGGYNPARRIAAVSAAAGLETMIGCMDEPGLGIAAGLHFALSQENIAYADLDSFLDLEEDPSADAVVLSKGILYPRSGPGFGTSPNIF